MVSRLPPGDAATGVLESQVNYSGVSHTQNAAIGEFDLLHPGPEIALCGKSRGLFVWNLQGDLLWHRDVPTSLLTKGDWDGDGDEEIMAFGLGANVDGMFSVWNGKSERLYAISFLPSPSMRTWSDQHNGGSWSHAMPGGHEGIRRQVDLDGNGRADFIMSFGAWHWGSDSILFLMAQAAPGASFIMLNDPALSTGFEQRWNDPAIWQYVDGVDDGTAGIPDGADTFTIDRTTGAFPANNTDLSNEGMPTHSIAGITATGAAGRDIILKYTADPVTIGDLTLLASEEVFEILEERVQSLIIDGVISGDGNLLLSRASGFSPDGTQPDDLITITGSSPNTITGTIRLYNSNGDSQPSYWVADKVGAFGQAPELTIEGRAGLSGAASLQITSNAMGGEGAIDDDATTVLIGAEGVLSIDAGVDEKIGEGNLLIDLEGTGTYTEVPSGVYNNSADWITGDGKVTVGPVAAAPVISSIAPVGDGTWELTLVAEASTGYEFRSATDLVFDPGALVENLTPGETPVGTIGGPNDSLLITDSNGDGTVRMMLTGDPADFIRAQVPPPVTLFEENFDGVIAGELPADWTSGRNDPADTETTQWELGTPSAVGPTAANSAPNCVATNISADYGLDTDIWLRTPSIDLTAATAATLSLKQFRDIEALDGVDLDFGSILILAADDLAELAVLETTVEGTDTDWQDYSKALPAAAFDEPILIEFRFESDELDNFAGWYIDDVVITAPAS